MKEKGAEEQWKKIGLYETFRRREGVLRSYKSTRQAEESSEAEARTTQRVDRG